MKTTGATSSVTGRSLVCSFSEQCHFGHLFVSLSGDYGDRDIAPALQLYDGFVKIQLYPGQIASIRQRSPCGGQSDASIGRRGEPHGSCIEHGRRRGPQSPGRSSNTPAIRDRNGAVTGGIQASIRRAGTSRARSRARRSRGSRCCRPRYRAHCRCRRSAARHPARSDAHASASPAGVGATSGHLVVRMEGGEVQRHVRARVFPGTTAPARRSSASSSLWPGISRVVISSQTVGLVRQIYSRVSSTGCR